MFDLDSGVVVNTYTFVSTLSFILAVRLGEWPIPQIVALIMVASLFGIGEIGDEYHGNLIVFQVILTICCSVAFSLMFNSLFGQGSYPLGIMFFILLFFGLRLDGMVESFLYNTRFGGGSICDQYSIFAVGNDASWASLKRGIEEDNLMKQKNSMAKLTATYHPTKCPEACRLKCAHTFYMIEDIRSSLAKEKI